MNDVIKSLIFLICIFHCGYSAFCGPTSVPTSLEVSNVGGLILGCARSPCLGVTPSQDVANQNAAFQDDGFVRNDIFPETQSPLQGVNPVCETVYGAGACVGPDQWVGGINPGTGVTDAPFLLVCCSYGPLQFSRQVGVALVSPGQIFSGGEVNPPSELTSYDYISNIQPINNSDGTVSYETFVSRLSCLDQMNTAAAILNRLANQQPVPVPPPTPAASSWQCFSGDSMVEIANGEKKRIDELQIGDWVVGKSSEGKIGLTKVESWIHRKTSESAEFLNLKFENNKNLKITSKHYIFKTNCENETSEFSETMISAGKLQVGDCLITKIKNSMEKLKKIKIVSITKIVEIGYYAPKTVIGNIFVNDIHASCYSNIDNDIMNEFYQNLKDTISSSWIGRAINEFQISLNQEETDLLPGTKIMASMAKMIINSGYWKS